MSISAATKIPYTRLRYIRSGNPDKFGPFLRRLEQRVQIYTMAMGSDGKWYLWFVPDDTKRDVPSLDLDDA